MGYIIEKDILYLQDEDFPTIKKKQTIPPHFSIRDGRTYFLSLLCNSGMQAKSIVDGKETMVYTSFNCFNKWALLQAYDDAIINQSYNVDKDGYLYIYGHKCNCGCMINGYYTCVDCTNCIDCYYCFDCANCINCKYCIACSKCKGCKKCILCYGLYSSNNRENNKYER